MRIITANVNGIRSATDKGFMDWLLSKSQADILCVQEIKALETDLSSHITHPVGFSSSFHPAQKKGYSGVGIYYPSNWSTSITKGVGQSDFDAEGRVIRADFNSFSVISIYFPSGSSGEERQDVKFTFLDFMRDYLKACFVEFQSTGREFIFCGDWNIAHQEIDLKNWKGNLKNSGFLPEERAWLTEILAAGWVDVYRTLHPHEEGASYTWWSNRGQARKNNVGWRIDYQIATPGIAARAHFAQVYTEEKFSDHAPLIVDYDWNPAT